MDEGIAALVAGVAGMVGALGGAIAGAIGAVKGARVGAERTAEATRQQVLDQSAAEHGHWLRQQRQAAYSAHIAAVQKAERAADAVLQSRFEDPDPQWQARVATYSQALEDLNDVSSQVSVLGPDGMIRAAGQVFRTARMLESRLRDIRHHPSMTTQDEVDRMDEAWDNFVEASHLFQEAARVVLVGASR
ncbi:hypothetical protein [Streptomyces sp. Ru73]|uniref:hypothetical protein n=1 Tax=Streptomyces sp. Ru73 TaxID=2080748 RepID=UPI0011B0C64C|nr:hypothetical protein [Streptomyces sp. Ru73]